MMDSLVPLEAFCIAIVSVFVVVRAGRDPNPRDFLLRMFLLAAAGWVGENSVIHAYGFYSYSPEWSLFIDQVPVMIVVIWPMVIHSAWDLARRLSSPKWTPWVAAGFVCLDAWLIEPVAVRAGLWVWTEPGLFEVPPVGVFGWSFFALGAVAALSRLNGLRRGLVVIAAPLACHALLLSTWWLLFRWVNQPIPDLAGVIIAWGVGLAVMIWSLRTDASAKVPVAEMMLRGPAAAFFFVLVALTGGGLLWWYAPAFAPPYLSLMDPKRRYRAD
jgi:hypothetical protein